MLEIQSTPKGKAPFCDETVTLSRQEWIQLKADKNYYQSMHRQAAKKIDDMKAAFAELQQAAQQKQQLAQAEIAQANSQQAEAYLAENASKEGVVVTESGLQYKVINEGSGKTPGPDDIVSVNYEGRLVDGTVFDSSYQRGEPAKFPVGGVIAGWTEALQLMKEGSKLELYVPPALAYGARGAGQRCRGERLAGTLCRHVQPDRAGQGRSAAAEPRLPQL